MLLRTTNEFMGWAGLKLEAGPANEQHDFYDLGYRLLPRFWGQECGFEAAQASLTYGFGTMALSRICAQADVENIGSRRILEKIGMQQGNAFEEKGMRCVWYEALNPHQT